VESYELGEIHPAIALFFISSGKNRDRAAKMPINARDSRELKINGRVTVR
jgi:hypothetical protein